MKIGVSLSVALLCGRTETVQQERLLTRYKNVENWLACLKNQGTDFIELRTVEPVTPLQDVAAAAQAIKQAGLFWTAHGVLADEPAKDFWHRLSPLLEPEKELVVTVHSLDSRPVTNMLLRRLSEYALEHQLPARLALENNRIKGGNAELVECGGVLKTLHELDVSMVGSCWDFGHLYSDFRRHPEQVPEIMPPEGFVSKAIHTHIHTLYEGSTHFPLTCGELPLKEYLTALHRAGYQGVCNLEPEMERWPDDMDAGQEILNSVKILCGILEEIYDGR